jgi:hypothetical protein
MRVISCTRRRLSKPAFKNHQPSSPGSHAGVVVGQVRRLLFHLFVIPNECEESRAISGAFVQRKFFSDQK